MRGQTSEFQKINLCILWIVLMGEKLKISWPSLENEGQWTWASHIIVNIAWILVISAQLAKQTFSTNIPDWYDGDMSWTFLDLIIFFFDEGVPDQPFHQFFCINLVFLVLGISVKSHFIYVTHQVFAYNVSFKNEKKMEGNVLHANLARSMRKCVKKCNLSWIKTLGKRVKKRPNDKKVGRVFDTSCRNLHQKSLGNAQLGKKWVTYEKASTYPTEHLTIRDPLKYFDRHFLKHANLVDRRIFGLENCKNFSQIFIQPFKTSAWKEV